MRKTTLTMPPFRWLHPRAPRSRSRECVTSWVSHSTSPALPFPSAQTIPNCHFLFYKSYRCAWQAHVCTPCFCVMSNLKLIWAHWKPLVGFYGFCVTDSASGQSHFSQEAACGFHVQFISTHSWMKWGSECKTVNWFDYWFSRATYSKNCPVPLDQVC